jgi:hypothetical protein
MEEIYVRAQAKRNTVREKELPLAHRMAQIHRDPVKYTHFKDKILRIIRRAFLKCRCLRMFLILRVEAKSKVRELLFSLIVKPLKPENRLARVLSNQYRSEDNCKVICRSVADGSLSWSR